MRRKGGFTLLEVMVASVIIAVGFAAVWRAQGLATDALELTRNKTLAMWAIKNKIAEYRDTKGWPDLGETREAASAGPEPFSMRQTVTKTPSASFRKVTIEVFRNAEDSYVLARLTGYVTNEKALVEIGEK